MGSNKGKKNGFLVQGGILAMASIIVRIIGLIYRIPLTRIIGDEGMSFYGMAFEVYNIALLLSSYSLPLAVSKLVAMRLAKGEKRNAYEIFKCAFVFALCAGVLIAVIIFAGAGFIADKLLNSYLSYIALRVLAPGLFVVALLGVLRGYFQGYGSMIPTAISQILEQILNAIVSVVAAALLFSYAKKTVSLSTVKDAKLVPHAYGAAGGTLGTVSGAVLALVFLAFVFFAFMSREKRAIKMDRTLKLESASTIFPILFKTIIPVILSSVIYNICNICDQAVFNAVMKSHGVAYSEYAKLLGIYTGKFLLLINVPLAIANAMGASSIPSLSTSLVQKNYRDVRSKISMAIKFTMLIAIPAFMGYTFLGSPILRLLFADSNRVSALVMTTGSVMVVFYSLSTVTNAILQGLDRMMYPIKNALVSLVIHFAVLFISLMIFRLGIYSLVIANCVFSLCMCILNQKDIKKVCGYDQEFKKTFIIPIICALIMGVIARLVYTLLNTVAGNAISTVFAILVGGFVYIWLIVNLGILSKDIIARLPKGELIVRLFTIPGRRN